MTKDPEPSLQSLLRTLSSIPLSSGDSLENISTVEGLDTLDIAGLLKQMDNASLALENLDARTDNLMKKIDALLVEADEEGEAKQGAGALETEKNTGTENKEQSHELGLEAKDSSEKPS
ncbi:hypothetical protein BC832DRAFT_542910 [Gaertneriomyces semiglobifer]|nr:hypothetical protein BC832DRAFT_542910 [Gaertneriomyces semiglobifer]